MKIFTVLLLAFLSIQSFCPMQMGVSLMAHEKSQMAQEDCPTAHCLNHESKAEDALFAFNPTTFPPVPLAVQPASPCPSPSFEAPLFHTPPPLLSPTKTIVLRI